MKIYTEEQVIEIAYWITASHMTREKVKSSLKDLNQQKSLTPIELPSDEEIEKYIEKTFYGEKKYYFKAGIDFIKQTLIRQKND